MISVIIPVLHEEKEINTLLKHVHRIAKEESYEIIVVDGDFTGSTIQTIADEKIFTLSSAKGRGRQMNRGARAARGNILLFLHADTRLPERAFQQIREALEYTKYVGGAFDLGIHSKNFFLGLTARAASLKHRLTRVPYGDQAIFLRTDFFRQIGGYREIPLYEDVEIMRRIKKLGNKITIIRSRTLTSARKWKKEGIIYTILRNWTLQILHLLGASPEFLARHYHQK
jgi:rSAM/selenodomain-associated transferase 2